MRPTEPTAVLSPSSCPLVCAGVFAAAALFASPCLATAQLQAQSSAPAPGLAQLGRVPAAKASAPVAKPPAKRPTKPLWSELTPAHHQALRPLATTWDTLSETQKRKWLALSQNFPLLSGAEQSKLHSRMTEWVGLSPQQRAQARLSFGETQQLSADDKKAKWEAYQALSPEEKRKFAATASKPPPTATAVRPVAPAKLADVPKATQRPQVKPARIAAAPDQVDHNTLLPQHAAPVAPLN